MAYTRPAGRLHWLLIGPLVLQSALPAAALEAVGKGLDRTPETLLAQAPSPADPGIPKEVHGWFDAAKAAAAKGDSAEALQLQKQVVAWVQANRPALDVFRARALINLGNFLSEVGQKQEALAPTEEAVRILRQVEGSQPEARRFLAMALKNLGFLYRDLGRHQVALAPTEETVKIIRELAKFNPAFQENLVMALMNLGVSYSELGRLPEALPPTEEAVKISRELAKTNPTFKENLAMALMNLVVSYDQLGRGQDALDPTKEALMIFRELAKTNSAFLVRLGSSLQNLGFIYNNLGRRQEALAPTEEAVKITRDLAKFNPAYQAEDLASSTTNLAILHLQLGKPSAALPLLKETVSKEVTYLQGQLPLLPEARRLALLEVFGDRWQIPFSQALAGVSTWAP